MILRSWRFWLAVALLVMLVIGPIAWFSSDNETKRDLAWSFVIVAIFVALVLVLLEVAGRGNPNPERKALGYLEIVLGLDGRFSTSKAMVALWTLVFASSLVLLSAMVWFSPMTPEQAFGQEWDSYLLLLGGPFAAAVLAKAITTSQAESGGKSSTLAASSGLIAPAPSSTVGEPRAGDVSRNDSGELSLPDTQYWVFSFVAIAYFVGAFVSSILEFANNACQTPDATDCVKTLGLPGIPPALLGLTSLAAATYVGAKAVSSSTGVRLTSLVPNPVEAGEDITINLINAPESLTQNQIAIRFIQNGQPWGGDRSPSAPPVRAGLVTTFTAQAPAEAGTYAVVVAMPSGTSAPTNLVVKITPP